MTDIENYSSKDNSISHSFQDNISPAKNTIDRRPLANLFQGVLEERKSTQRTFQENFDRIIDAHSKREKNLLESPIDSDLSVSKSGIYEKPLYNDKKEKDDGTSNNTSALLEDNFDDLDIIGGTRHLGNKEYVNLNKESSGTKEKLENERNKYGINDEEVPRQNKNDLSGDSSSEDSYEHPKLFNKSNNYESIHSQNYASKSKRFEDDTLGSGMKFYDSLRTEDFKLVTSPDKDLASSRNLNVGLEKGLQINKTSVDFGLLFPTENKEETLELLNKGREEVKVDLKVYTNKSSGKYFILTNEEETPQEELSFVLAKYEFKTIRIIAETNNLGLENDPELNGLLVIKSNNIENEVNLTCKIENPSLQVLDSSIDKMVGSVPFLNLDLKKQGRDNELIIPFRNNGQKLLLLEFELVNNPKLAEVIFSPKYLSLKEGEEKILTIKSIRSFDYENKNKTILKYKIKGTRLCQCLVINLDKR